MSCTGRCQLWKSGTAIGCQKHLTSAEGKRGREHKMGDFIWGVDAISLRKFCDFGTYICAFQSILGQFLSFFSKNFSDFHQKREKISSVLEMYGTYFVVDIPNQNIKWLKTTISTPLQVIIRLMSDIDIPHTDHFWLTRDQTFYRQSRLSLFSSVILSTTLHLHLWFFLAMLLFSVLIL